MKKIIITILLIFVSITIKSQIYISNTDNLSDINKSITNPTYKWSTIITYDTTGNLNRRYTNEICWWWNKIASETVEKYDSTWINESRHLYTYDGLGNLLKDKYQTWNNTWINNSQYDYYYSENKLISKIISNWQDSNWVNNQKIDYIYMADSTSVQNQITSIWTDTSANHFIWKQFTMFEFISYTVNNNIKSYISYKYENGWKPNFFGEYTYLQNNIGDELMSEYLTWNRNDSMWVYNSKTTLNYDNNFNCINSLLQYWVDSSWVNDQGGYATFDSNNDRTIYTWGKWDSTGWKSVHRLLTTYDNNHNSLSQVLQDSINGNWTPSQNWVLIVNSDNNRYYISYKNQHRYEATFLPYYDGINNITKNKIEIYPNPTKDYINFNQIIKDFKLYNIFGQLVSLDMNIKRVDISNLNNGVYIGIINNETFKIIKQ